MHELQQYVAETADRLGLHATPATLLLDLQARVGALADQTGVDTGRAVQTAADRMYGSAMAQQRQQPAAESWPFSG